MFTMHVMFPVYVGRVFVAGNRTGNGLIFLAFYCYMDNVRARIFELGEMLVGTLSVFLASECWSPSRDLTRAFVRHVYVDGARMSGADFAKAERDSVCVLESHVPRSTLSFVSFRISCKRQISSFRMISLFGWWKYFLTLLKNNNREI